MLLFGPLGDVVNIDWLMLASGGVMFLLAVPFVASKVLRKAGAPPENGAAAAVPRAEAVASAGAGTGASAGAGE
jgi:DHA3 family macrolide efflux protein-like MFS transporter